GGISEHGGSALWMRSAPLPPPTRKEGAIIALGPGAIAWNDPLARHKSLNYWSRRLAFEEARRQGFDEVLCISPGSYYSYYWEGSRTNLFLIRNVSLSTPCLDGPIVPGVMRALVLEHARELPLVDVHEETGLRMGEIR